MVNKTFEATALISRFTPLLEKDVASSYPEIRSGIKNILTDMDGAIIRGSRDSCVQLRQLVRENGDGVRLSPNLVNRVVALIDEQNDKRC